MHICSDSASLVVLDHFFGENERTGLLDALTGGGYDFQAAPPESRWERNTADDTSAARTWGLREDSLAKLAGQPPPAMIEIQTRLVKMYPEYFIAHMPSTDMQTRPDEGFDCRTANTSDPSDDQQSNLDKANVSGRNSRNEREVEKEASGADCCNLLANAPVHGDHYEWHVDADPLTLPDCEWRRHFGDYCNREPGMPLLVSLLLYLVDDGWDRNLHAETLFLDSATDVGLVVRPRRFRAVLMDQDVLHRVVAPSRLAESQPRYSLVWKLAFLPRQAGQACCVALPEWGPPVNLGSAARLEAVKRSLTASEKRKRQNENNSATGRAENCGSHIHN